MGGWVGGGGKRKRGYSTAPPSPRATAPTNLHVYRTVMTPPSTTSNLLSYLSPVDKVHGVANVAEADVVLEHLHVDVGPGIFTGSDVTVQRHYLNLAIV